MMVSQRRLVNPRTGDEEQMKKSRAQESPA
jgi:hypothetical protein